MKSFFAYQSSKTINVFMLIGMIFSTFNPYKTNAQSQVPIYDVTNNASTLQNEISIPANKVIYYPFDGETTATFPNQNYNFGYHVNNFKYSIDFFLHASYGGIDSEPGRNDAYIYPIASGKVISAGYSNSFGYVVYISHLGSLGEEFVSIYGHMKEDSLRVSSGQEVTVNTRLGIQGNTGWGIPSPNKHLHLSLVDCAPFPPTEALKPGAGSCTPVRPESMIGKYANEKFNWWPRNDGTNNQGIGTYIPEGDRIVAPNLLNDTTSPEEGWWNSGTTLPNSPENPLSQTQPIIFDIHAGDSGSGIGEIRLTANYSGWHPDPEGAWRIIARCRPGESSECSGGNWRYTWNWATETKPFDPAPLKIPWMTGARTILKNSGNQSVCISFDVFDLAGNPRYAPQGALCNFNTGANATIVQPLQDDGARLIYLDTGSSFPWADKASFISDITIPNGTIVSPSQSLIKTWRVKNSGTSTWSGYKLKFVDGEQMNGPTEINLPTTAPGEIKDISINLKAPASSGAHSGAWQITNAGGTWVSGGKLWIKINVQTGNGNITLDADPASPSTASTVRLHARVTPFSTFRAMRIKIDGSVVYELGAPEFYFDWNTGGYAVGDHSIIIEVADLSDTSWSRPQRQSLVYTLQGNTGIVNHAPNRPIPITNPAYDWYVTIGNPPQLCAQDQGDPDGDTINQYRFVASASVGTGDSGWNNGSCYTFGSLTPGTYEWHAQVKDSNGGISDWSDKWHFTVEPSGISASINSFSPASPSNAEEVKIYACTSGHAGVNITMRVLVNEANDGSDSGNWNIIKEQGSPCFNDIDVPIWKTLGYSDGQHRVRVVAWAIQPDAGATADAVYTLNHRRPNSPVLKAPVPLSQDIREPIYVNSRTVTFKWNPTIRATSYKLHIGTNPSPANDSNPVFRQTFDSSVSQYTVNFTQDYSTLYWQVEAINDIGSNFSGDQIFGIDRQVSTCSVQAPPPPIYESVFQVNWNGSDNLSGISHFDIQYQDSTRGAWEDWLGEVPASKGYELFTGQAGHTYSFRCRAQDNAGNTGDYLTTAGVSVTIDPSTRPTTPWWNLAYAQKRGITLLNNMPGMALPNGYPVHLHFDSGTTPTAAELYNASASSTKCNDIRVVFNETTELNRVVQSCSSAAIDIWFRSSISVAAGSSDNVSHQLYYGNASAGAPPGDPNQVWYPYLEAGTTYLYFLQENGGSTAYDSSGNGRNCSIDSSVQWSASKFGSGLRFNRANSGNSRSLNCGSAIPLSAFTIEFWYKPDADDGGRVAGELAGGGNGGGGNNWMIEIFDGKLRFNTWPCPGCGGSDVRSDAILTSSSYAGTWNHVAVTFNGGNEVKFYINGNLDSTKYLSQSGINTYSPPLEIGSSEGISQTKANLGTFRISNGVKTSFPYGTYAQIVNEPTTAVGDVVSPPITGTIDLVILNMSTYPNPGGGLIVQVDVKNQGTLDTKSGFYTDLYLDHVPTGSGDYTGSLQFWVSDPIPADGTASLTTVITNLSSLGAAPVVSNSIQETNGTLFAQTDSMGIVPEADNRNNIYSSGVPICIAQSDEFSADDTYGTASTIVPGTPQTHNFDKLGDQDWIKFTTTAGNVYLFTTSALGASSDTYLYLYDIDGTTLLTSNDDYSGTLASQFEWQAPVSGTYYILANNWNPNIGGCGTQYTISVLSSEPNGIFISGKIGTTDATLSYTDGTPKTITTDGSGNYILTVSSGWSGTVTPWKSGAGFTPANRTYTNVSADQSGQDYTPFACSTTDVTIAGSLSGSYCLISGQSTRQSYATNNGPVKIGTNAMPILAAQRILYYANSAPTSFVEMMGLPDGQLDKIYWFPWYKNDGIVDTQLRIGNVSASNATVHIYIAGAEVTGSPFTLTKSGAGQSQRLSFALNDGPVKIVSDQNIVTTERLIYFNGGVPVSFSEMLGLPNSQLSNTYWFPWYKNAGEVDTQLRIGNVSDSTATVHIYIAGVEVMGSPFTLTASGAGQSQRLSFPVNNGPVKIVSDVNIVAAQRILYYAGGVPTSFVETMGIPDGQLGTTHWFPWYKNDGIVDTQLRIGNVSGLAASVHVYIGTAEMAGSPFTLTATGAGQSLRLSFTANDGPVKIVSDQNIVTSERLIYFNSGVPVSFSEMMGLPDNQLSNTYWLPWYKNVGEIDTQLRFGMP